MKKERKRTRNSIDSGQIEAYKMLLITLESLMNKKDLKIIAFSCLTDVENKSKHVFNIAKLMVKEGKRILLLECDSRDSKVNQYFEDLNQEETNNNLSIQNLDVLIYGQKVKDTEYVLNTLNITTILEAERNKYDVILIDTPPVGYSADGIKLCASAEGTVIIMRAGHASVDLSVKAKEMLDTVDAKVVGIILEK